MIIYVGDSQIKEKEPVRSGVLSFWDWLYENYPEAIIIHGGDAFESSSHSHDLVTEVMEKMLKFKEVHVLRGNHDYSKKMSCIFKPFTLHSNFYYYDTATDFEIEGIRFKALPHNNYNEKVYEEILEADNIDYSISHFTPIQESFGNDGVELKFKVNVAHIFSHIHLYKEFKDNFGNQILIAGSVLPFKVDEVGDKFIHILEKDKYTSVSIPQYYTYETLEYGQQPTNKNNIINVTEAPSKQAVFEFYKGYYIRQEGIKLKRTDQNKKQLTIEDVKNTFDKDNLVVPFIKWAEEEKTLKKEIYDDCVLRLQKNYEEVKV